MPCVPVAAREVDRMLKRAIRTFLVEVAHALRKGRRDRAIVLLYHRVLPSPRPGDAWALSVTEFTRQLSVLDEQGFHDVPLGELEGAHAFPRGRRVLIAFDDGYANAVEFALPVLRSFGRSAAFFLVTDRLAQESDWERGSGLEPSSIMTWDDARRLVERGLAVGSHSATHADLGRAADAEIAHEVAASKRTLERELGIAVRSFSVPYGRDDGRIDAHLQRSGYAAKFTNPIAAGRTSQLAVYPVVGIVRSDGPRTFERHLSGATEVIWAYHRLRARLRRPSRGQT